jgi:diaminohydroxyphosphoribosylaminopyrimidine deaminase/5-amino-6-(5-phosphoribosylamino)uracil reductase
MEIHEKYMRRCFDLAQQGAGFVAPNPMVGAVLVHNDLVIGEGYHHRYGEAHAEMNCIQQAIENGHKHLIQQSFLYVSLEPCSHFGKTPPCADLIIRNRIPGVFIGCRDPFPEVNGKGIEKLEAAGLNVVTGVLEEESKHINRRFFIYNTQHRPYIILKWAESADGKIAALGASSGSRLLISNEYTNRLVHKWRSEESAILVGTNTVQADDPELTTRLWPGPSPVRLIVDMELRLPIFSKIFTGPVRTVIFNTIKHEEDGHALYYQVTQDVSIVHQIINAAYQMNLQSVIVEGGAKLLQSFIDEGMWDEARVITNSDLTVINGLSAPKLKKEHKTTEEKILSDSIATYIRG